MTIPRDERMQVVGQIIYHISDRLTIMGLFYNSDPGAISNRLSVTGEHRRIAWDAHEWALR